MRLVLASLAAAAAGLLALQVSLAPGRDAPVKKPFGIDKRVPWTASRVKGSPEPPDPYRTEVAFPRLPQFSQPLDFSRAPGTDRFFLAERFGKIFSFANDPQTDKADLFIDLKKTVYAIAAHPQFAQNGYLFVTYVLDPKET